MYEYLHMYTDAECYIVAYSTQRKSGGSNTGFFGEFWIPELTLQDLFYSASPFNQDVDRWSH